MNAFDSISGNKTWTRKTVKVCIVKKWLMKTKAIILYIFRCWSLIYIEFEISMYFKCDSIDNVWIVRVQNPKCLCIINHIGISISIYILLYKEIIHIYQLSSLSGTGKTKKTSINFRSRVKKNYLKKNRYPYI